MGTNLQSQNLTPDDFGGEKYYGCNEYLVVTKPSAIEKVHSNFLIAGCDVIETNTFGATSVVLQEYNLAEKSYELNYKSAQLAKRIADDFSNANQRRFVAGSMGPTTKLPSLGHISFVEMQKSYYIQAKGLIEGGADLLVIETCQDILQSKAALAGVFSCMHDIQKKIPVIVSVTIESTSTMLLGTEISAALTTLEPYPIDVLGINCATGPKEMSEPIRFLSFNSPLPIFCMPNAGIPENVGGKAHYHLPPDVFVASLSHFVKDFGVNIVGGCCGTTSDHIKKLAESVGSLAPLKRKWEFTPSVSSLYQSVPLHIEPAPVLIGERTNANGSKLFRDLLLKEDWEGIVALGKDQVKEGAHILDLCVAYVGRDEKKDMCEVASRFNTQITAPLMIDSTDPSAIEAALQRYAGKAIINSVNLEDGEKRFAKIMNLATRYGSAVVALTIDEEGMAKTAARKFEIAERIRQLALEKYRMKEENLIFDTLTFTLGSGDKDFRNAGVETLEAIGLIKKNFPNVKTSLGISNISFGLKPQARVVLNSVFLRYAIEYGLDMAIAHAGKIMPLYKIKDEEREICRKLIFNELTESYNPLKEFINYYSGHKKEGREVETKTLLPVEERLKFNIVDGDKNNLTNNLEEGLKKYKPIDIINNILLDGMKVVGELFGGGKMQLPFVLQSAEVMKAAVAYLEPYMEKVDAQAKGTMVLATVKGDVHDIGKNLVNIILSNNGYKIINLGIRVPVEKIIQATEEYNADAIGMSGLLVKSTAIMKENLEIMNERGITIPVVLGGAALTRRFVEEDLRSIYGGSVSYANDVFDGLYFMENLSQQKYKRKDILEAKEKKITISAKVNIQEETSRSIKTNAPIPVPPFWGSNVVEEIELDEVFEYLNEIALIKGQWQVYKGNKTEEEYRSFLKEAIYPELQALKLRIKSEKLLTPKVIYGYFPCQSDGNDLIIYKPKIISNIESAYGGRISNPPKADEFRNFQEWMRFTFPRQKSDRFLCLSDYFASKTSSLIDVVAFQIVTVGSIAVEYSKKLYSQNSYKDYLYFHGISVKAAEALAELWHKKIRQELNIHQKDATEKKKIFSQGYQGSRYSFGYPACPNLEDQVKLFELLKPERIGIELTEEFHLVPEQSTSAIIVHHPEAKYFNI
ncbi:MAG: methionine synthase [Bacteroidetes bacterium]|nr:methionine synthase [Bacteroidota bacterium]